MKTVLSAIRDSLSRAVLPEADYERQTRRLPIGPLRGETGASPARPGCAARAGEGFSPEGFSGKNRVSREGLADAESLRTRFTVEAQALTVQVHAATNRAEAIDLVLSIVQGCAAEAVIAWDEEDLPLPREGTQPPGAPHLPAPASLSRSRRPGRDPGRSPRGPGGKCSVPEISPGVWETLRAAGVQVLDSTLPRDGAGRMARLADLDRAAVGVTGALAGLADTGSLALASGPGRGRLTSLLPPVLVALLPVTKLYPTMAAFFADHPDVVRQASNLVFITGPSRTADIEQTLTLGVHGPRELHVILLDM